MLTSSTCSDGLASLLWTIASHLVPLVSVTVQVWQHNVIQVERAAISSNALIAAGTSVVHSG